MRKMKGALAGKCTSQPFTANIVARLKEPELMQLRAYSAARYPHSTQSSAAAWQPISIS